MENIPMAEKPTYEDLEKRIRELEKAEHEREQTEFALHRRLKFEQLVKEISSEFAGVGGGNSIDSAINRALSSVGKFTGADRAYIFSFKNVAARADNTHEWCTEDIKPQIDNLKDIPIDEELPWFTKHIRNHEIFHVPKVAALPHEALLERKHFEAQNIQSLIVVPMETTERLIGFLGFDAVTKSRTWSEDDKNILQFLAQTLSHVIERKIVEDALRESEAFLQVLLDAIPAPVFYKDRNGRYLGFNMAFETFFGKIRELIIGKSVFEINPPELAEIYRAKDEELFNSGGVQCYESQWKNDHGELRDFIFNKAVFTDSKGTVNGLIGALTDITERKRAEVALLESEEKFRLISEQSLMAIVIVQDDRIKYANQAYMEMTGYTWEEIMNWTMRDIVQTIHPDDIPFVMEQGRKKAAGISDGVVTRYAYRGFTKSGEVRWIDQYSKTITYMGKPANLSTFIDIHNQKLAQETLIQSEKRYRDLADSLPQIVFETDENGNLTFVNRNAFDIFGYSQNDFDRGINTLEVLIPEDRKRAMENMQKLMNSGRPGANEYTALRKDGSIFPVSIHANRLIHENRFIGFRGIIIDLTQTKKAEEALRESEEKYKFLTEKMADIIWTLDRNFRTTYVSPSIEKALGFTPKERKRQSLEEMVTPESAQKVQKKLLEEIQRDQMDSADLERSIMVEVEYYRKDGSTLWMENNLKAIRNLEGTIMGMLGVSRDITKRKQAETALRESEERLSRARKMESLGLMAGGIAHDLNNILSGIVTYPELLLMDLPEESPLRKPIKTIQKSGMRAVDVVADLLTIARGVATGKEVLNLNTIVTEYLGSPEHEELEKTHSFVDFKTELNSQLLNMNSSPTHIKKTLMNLVINASEAIEGSGTVTISTVNRYLDEPLKGYEDVYQGEYVVLSVSDEGRGITPEDLERIFEPFYTKKIMGRSGTGLGLAVVWNTVQDHKGYIDIKSSEKGTAFELYFPVTRDEVTAKREDVPLEDYLGHGEKILVVDDEERQREIACGILTKLGYNAEAVSSGEEAIEYVKEKAVDLIVLDMVMPKGINGRKTYQEIIKIRPGQKAVIASGYAKTKEVEMAQELGAGKYIKKPYTLEKIGVAVKKELENRQVFDPQLD
jgi:PAS domain S-box-containing protein